MSGKAWDRRLIGPRAPRPSDGPVNGCMNGCGEARPWLLRTYSLVDSRGQIAGQWQLCADCLVWGNPRDPQDADPLHVPAA